MLQNDCSMEVFRNFVDALYKKIHVISMQHTKILQIFVITFNEEFFESQETFRWFLKNCFMKQTKSWARLNIQTYQIFPARHGVKDSTLCFSNAKRRKLFL